MKGMFDSLTQNYCCTKFRTESSDFNTVRSKVAFISCEEFLSLGSSGDTESVSFIPICAWESLIKKVGELRPSVLSGK